MQALELIGVQQSGWQWRYNPSVRRPGGQFGPHRAQAGKYLQLLPDDDGFYPGDHKGCRCQATPVLRGPDGRFVTSSG